MPARTVDAYEYTQVDTQPFRIRCTTVSTALVPRKGTNLCYNLLIVDGKRLGLEQARGKRYLDQLSCIATGIDLVAISTLFPG